MGRSGIRAAYGTGRGRIYVRARAEIVEKPNGRYQIVVTELPYQVNKARLIENIAELVKDKRIDGISNIDDHSDRNGMHIAIDIKREASPQLVLNHLYSLTQMQVTFGVIMLAIVDGQPKLAHPCAIFCRNTSSSRVKLCCAARSSTLKRRRSAPTFWKAS